MVAQLQKTGKGDAGIGASVAGCLPLEPAALLVARFRFALGEGLRQAFPDLPASSRALLAEASADAMARLQGCNALYHNYEHTILVTLVGQQILIGMIAEGEAVTPSDWLNTIVSLLYHDIGYVRRLCDRDGEDGLVASGIGNERVRPQEGASDASLQPFHVNRGKCYVSERYAGHPVLDVEVIRQNIERTRFPIPSDEAYLATGDWPGLVRGADLIGQLADRRYLQKLPAVFYEFEEVGFNQLLGYRTPQDLLHGYPAFFEQQVEPWLDESLAWLKVTGAGRRIVADLYRNVEEARRLSRR
ncbi:MAG: metal-dependent phosphohydrolase [Gammaproteobacteria bacterium]|nr:MAG: metal-dependent phosphohydrolase [Gammaproteobacteria bacterium]